jgi:NADPH:quinone reductase-like Zn-dependent oxidoreductase
MKLLLDTMVHKAEDLVFLRAWIQPGKIKTVVDRRYPLEQTAKAHRYIETGMKKGNMINTVTHT